MLHRIFAYHLAALVLLTNIGIPVFTHVCNGQGKEWSSVLLPARSCCSKQKAVKQDKACHVADRGCEKGIQPKPCCENRASVAQMHADFLTNLEAWSVKKLDIALPALTLASEPISFLLYFSTSFPFRPHAPPVPLHGRSLLIFEQIFRC